MEKVKFFDVFAQDGSLLAHRVAVNNSENVESELAESFAEQFSVPATSLKLVEVK